MEEEKGEINPRVTKLGEEMCCSPHFSPGYPSTWVCAPITQSGGTPCLLSEVLESEGHLLSEWETRQILIFSSSPV